MLALYHNPMSSASQKVRLCLAEKGLEWTGHIVNLRAGEQQSESYLKLNARGVVPTLIDDDVVIPESTVINEYLEQKYPEVALMPAAANERAKVRLWTKQVDDSLHDLGIAVLAFAVAFRPGALAAGDAALAQINKIPDIFKRERRRDLLVHGMESMHFRGGLMRLRQMLQEMNAALADTPWLVGQSLTLADLSLVPYVLRMRELGLGGLIGEHRNVSAWFARCELRPSFGKAVVSFQDEAALKMMAAAGETASPKIKDMLDGAA
jgi:glutathione S-transferase